MFSPNYTSFSFLNLISPLLPLDWFFAIHILVTIFRVHLWKPVLFFQIQSLHTKFAGGLGGPIHCAEGWWCVVQLLISFSTTLNCEWTRFWQVYSFVFLFPFEFPTQFLIRLLSALDLIWPKLCQSFALYQLQLYSVVTNLFASDWIPSLTKKCNYPENIVGVCVCEMSRFDSRFLRMFIKYASCITCYIIVFVWLLLILNFVFLPIIASAFCILASADWATSRNYFEFLPFNFYSYFRPWLCECVGVWMR